MPGRTSMRSSRTSNATDVSKATTTTRAKRGSKSTRTSAHAVEIPDEGPVTSLRTQICHIFSDAQKTTATQRKLVVNLRKVQEACCYEAPEPKKNTRPEEEFDETEFNEEIWRCMVRVLPVKKSEPAGDRIIRFLGVFLKHATEKDISMLQSDEDAPVPESPTSRLTAHVVTNLLQFLAAKDKVVRFRATQAVAHVINSLDQIDDDLFYQLRQTMGKRLRDKETNVRVQAALGLGRLGEGEEDENDDEDSDDDHAGGILTKLLDVMQNDQAAEVRRSILINLPFRTSTLSRLLERARDTDPAIRRALYSKILPVLGDFRHLSISHREKLLRWGLRDRDEHVRKAAALLFSTRWIEDCSKIPTSERVPNQVSPPNMDDLLELLERIEVVRAGQEDGIAHTAMHEFWDGRPDYVEFATFDDDYWNELTAESAFLVRSLNDYGQVTRDGRVQEMIEEKMPELVQFAFHVQTHMNALVTLVHEDFARGEPDEEAMDIIADKEFVVEQLLHMALTLDYADKIGRQQMYQIMREAIAQPALPEECTKLAVDVLRFVCGKQGESEFYGVVLEAIAEVRDTISDDDTVTVTDENGEESFHSAQSDVDDDDDATPRAKPRASKAEEDPDKAELKRIHAVVIYSKCLHIVQCMLQNLECDIDASEPLKTMLNTLIIPAVRDSATIIRERGLIGLGLCMLLSENLAANNIPLFYRCFAAGTELMKITAVHTFADIAITHPALLAPPPRETNVSEDGSVVALAVNPNVKNFTKVFLKAFASESPAISIAACTAASKLLLHGTLPPASTLPILRKFTLAYFNPESALNPALRQQLSYFLPVFCHSKLKNAHTMSQVAVPVIKDLISMREDIDPEDEEMVGWPVICAHLSEWTDGTKVVGATELSLEGKMVSVKGAEEPHLHLAIEILQRVAQCTREERKPLLSLLSKIHIPTSAPTKRSVDAIEEEQLRALHALVSEAVEGNHGTDATTRNMLSKLEAGLTKRLGEFEHVAQIKDEDASSEAEATEVEGATAAAQDAPTDAENETEAEVDDAASEAQNTEVSDAEEATVMQTQARGRASRQSAPVVYTSDVEMKDEDEDEDDTMLAHMQAEGTRIPLDYEDTMDVDEEANDTPRATRTAVTESDIMNELLESELE
ncbi:hypothetical protein K504DRAFT_485993 [Pleomassaria siparia CBS 279.74]|uniref:Nuclear condensin complex subunit 3 C-terminal domain-containing protein n=1 Tax=Pleomassaria siparia CBS 279.74 TaxID=1314801 RepID=A0A6G1JRW5_9PLEO|nr:hypothetical protein K504DRAFT_485993 [Pleomassaria siparia CBS 279.74]